MSSEPAVKAMTPKGSASAAAVIAPTTEATLLLAANARRLSALFVNGGSVTVYVGSTAAVTALTGIPIEEDKSFEDNATVGAWYGITAADTGNIRIVEVS